MSLFHYIDDNEILLEVFECVLDSMDLQVQVFASPVAYVEYANSAEYKVPTAIFTDIKMPVMNGHQLIDKVRKPYPNMKFITLSGFDDTLEGRHKNACMHILKPFKPEILEDLVATLVECEKKGSAAVEAMCNELSQKGTSISKNKQCPHQGACLAD